MFEWKQIFKIAKLHIVFQISLWEILNYINHKNTVAQNKKNLNSLKQFYDFKCKKGHIKGIIFYITKRCMLKLRDSQI